MSSQAQSRGKRATVIGGSIAGLTAGLALFQRGWDVHLHEATQEELDRRGAGIITHQTLFDILKSLGVSDGEKIGIAVHKRKIFAGDGTVAGELELSQIATSWGRMYQLLRNQFPSNRYHRNKAIVECEQDSDVVKATFSDGSYSTSELLVAADGIRSTVRQQLEPEAKPEYAGYMAWRGLLDEQDLSADEKRELLPYFTFCLPDGEQVLTYPIAGEQHRVDAGHRRCNVVWYRPADRDTTLRELLTDIDGNNNGESIAPDKVQPALVRKMQNDASRLLSPQHAALITKLQQPFIQPIYDLTTKKMAHERIALVGDAAFTARPHLGVGITKAAEDGMALANSLDICSGVTEALIHFDAQRRPVNHALVSRSRQLGAYLQAHQLSSDERLHAQLHRSKEAIMHETANLQTAPDLR